MELIRLRVNNYGIFSSSQAFRPSLPAFDACSEVDLTILVPKKEADRVRVEFEKRYADLDYIKRSDKKMLEFWAALRAHKVVDMSLENLRRKMACSTDGLVVFYSRVFLECNIWRTDYIKPMWKRSSNLSNRNGDHLPKIKLIDFGSCTHSSPEDQEQPV